MLVHQVKKAENDATKNLNIVQVMKDGKERFYVCKKKERTISTESEEEIFAEWAKNLDVPKKKLRQRTRKVTHRAWRKEIIKASKENTNGPLLYADMVKKNMKNRQLASVPVEDIFEAWIPAREDS